MPKARYDVALIRSEYDDFTVYAESREEAWRLARFQMMGARDEEGWEIDGLYGPFGPKKLCSELDQE